MDSRREAKKQCKALKRILFLKKIKRPFSVTYFFFFKVEFYELKNLTEIKINKEKDRERQFGIVVVFRANKQKRIMVAWNYSGLAQQIRKRRGRTWFHLWSGTFCTLLVFIQSAPEFSEVSMVEGKIVSADVCC